MEIDWQVKNNGQFLGQSSVLGRNSKYQNNMKTVSKRNISALFALLLAGTILTSAKSDSVASLSEVPTIEEAHYLEYVDEYVEDYYEEMDDELFETSEYVKVYDANNELLVAGERSELDQDQLQILRQADLLTEQSGTEYYQLNN
ncbi:hypothetical protein BFP97_08485 [Roseivirga sp. 4D4]|nr:hypothetical protein BFP97_08485 [Roseivirga sp. 4D4]